MKLNFPSRTKIFRCEQIAQIDQFTITHEPVSALDLMERASLQVANWLLHHISNERELMFFAGPGNNGGDALAIARLMADCHYRCRVFLLDFGKGLSGAPAANWHRLEMQGKVEMNQLSTPDSFPKIEASSLIIDGLFGSGLKRPLDGAAAQLVNHLNQSGADILAIDIPSGLFGEDNRSNNLQQVIRARYTLTFQFPKLSFFFAEHAEILGNWQILPIGLHPDALRQIETSNYLIDHEFVTGILKSRARFAHKGTFGHALLIAGAYGKMGAAVLASKACLRSGVGLLTTHVPHSGMPILQVTVPEAMCSIDPSDLMFTEFPDLKTFSAVGVGPGLGTKPNAQKALKELLLAKPSAMVLDADALNILSLHPDWYELLPENAILTPHLKEFERLAGASTDSYSRLQLQLEFSKRYRVMILLKGAFSSITFPDGTVVFNPNGNPGMGTAGSGDVLTGIITGLLAQNYRHAEAAVLGVYLHGLAGDLAAERLSQEAMIAGDITESLPSAFRQLHGK